MHKLIHLLLLSVSLIIGGCSTVLNNLPGVYTIDIQQGNRVSQEMINQLKPTMNKRQVLYIMGSPMLVDVFHKKRWDYLYSNQSGGESREQTRISLYFEGDILVGVQGDFKPTANTEKLSKEVTVEVPKRDLDKTMSEKIVGIFSSNDANEPLDVDANDNSEAEISSTDEKAKEIDSVDNKVEPTEVESADEAVK
jgi:outer membrane protein assembly factor BamE